MQILKSYLVGSRVGDWMSTARDKTQLMQAAWWRPEKIGTLVNDQLASLLAACLCEPGRVFVDVGAHIGSMVASARRRSNPSTILAIEAIPARAAALRARFPDVQVIECAVGEGPDREVAFFVDLRQSGYSSLAAPSRANQPMLEIKVALRSMGALLAGHDVGFIKIDIEGGELGALRSATEAIAACRPTVMFESSLGSGDRLGFATSALWRFFDGLDYAVLAPNRVAHNDPGLSLDMFNECHLYPRRTTNYFAVPREPRTDVRDKARAVQDIQVASLS